MIDIASVPAHERPPAYRLSGRTYYRGSSSGACSRMLALARREEAPLPAPQHLETAAHEGHLHEPDMLNRLSRDYGYKILETQSEYTIDRGAFLVLMHTDAIAELNGTQYVVECKSMSTAQFVKFKSKGFDDFFKYACQISLTMLATSLPAIYLVKDRNSGSMLPPMILKSPPINPHDVLTRLFRVEVHTKRGVLPDPEYEVGSMECSGCRYRHVCRTWISDPPEEELDDQLLKLDSAEKADVEQAVAAYRRAKILADEASELRAIATITLQTALDKLNVKKLRHRGMVWGFVNGRKYLPAAKVRAVLTPDAIKAIEEQGRPYLRVTDSGGGGNDEE